MTNAPRRVSPTIPALGVFFVVLAVFLAACFGAFTSWDDNDNIFANPHYLPVTPESVAQFWTTPYNQLYTPVTNTIWAACATVSRLPQPVGVLGSGMSPFAALPFHTLGVLFHAGAAVLVFLLLRRLTGSDPGAVVGALFWAGHPLQAEPVAWVTGHNNVYSGFFGVLALLLYVRAVQSGKPNYVGATVAFLFALLAKPTGVALPLLMVALELFVLRRPAKQWIPLFLTWAGLAVALTVFTRLSSPASENIAIELWKRPVIALDAIAFYLSKIVFPAFLGIDYGRLPDRVVFSWWGYVCAGVTLALFAACLYLWRHGARIPLAAFALLIAGLLPVLGFVPFYFMKISTVADRYVYLALLGPAFAVASLVGATPQERRRVMLAIAGALLAVLAARTVTQTLVWRDSETVFAHALTVNPRSVQANTNYGQVLSDKKDFEGALRHALLAARNAPGRTDLLNNLGIAFAERGRLPEAIATFREAIRLRPEEAESHYHLGVALADTGDLRGAVPAFREATRLNPALTEAWYRLGTTLGKTGPTDEAIAALSKTLTLRSADIEARYIRAVLLGNEKRDREAEAEFAEVTRRAPNYADAWYALGKMRVRLGKITEAKVAFARCLSIDPANTRAKAELARIRRGF
ncbi:MAG: tetratricopeptide repeat protein [Fibrella sp.]|nr:tetratricopeptide repeat protein [Armatimonadota bacterium]